MIEVLNLDNWREQTSDEYSDWLHRASAALTEQHHLEESGHSCRCERCRREEYSEDMVWDDRFGKLCPLCVELLSRTDCLERLKQHLQWDVERRRDIPIMIKLSEIDKINLKQQQEKQ